MKYLGEGKQRTISADPDVTLFVFEVCESYFEDEVRLIKLQEKIYSRLPPGSKFVVVPPGIKVKVLPTRGVYHREVLGDYEIEIIAKTEDDLRSRLNLCEKINAST